MNKLRNTRENYLGNTFGYLKVLHVNSEKTANNRTYFNCQCICGEMCIKRLDQLKEQNIPLSCGCKKDKKLTTMKKMNYELIGKTIGHLKIIGIDKERMYESKRVYYKAECDCGKIVSKRSDWFTEKERKYPKSCGCKNKVAMIGKKFNALEVIKELPVKKFKTTTNRYFLCLCSCGNTTEVTYPNLVNESTKNCGVCKQIDLTGQKIGKWSVISYSGYYVSPKGSSSKQYLCSCECGYKKLLTTSSLKSFIKSQGGCINCVKKDLTNNKFGMLTPIKEVDKVFHPSGQYSIMWLCACDCGKTTVISRKSLIKTGTKSCGCSSISKGEWEVARILDSSHVKYFTEYRINECRNIRPLPFDFLVFDDKGDIDFLIEYDGEQHYRARLDIETQEDFKRRQKHDSIKTKFCKENNIKLLRIPYWEYKNIEKILKVELNTLDKID